MPEPVFKTGIPGFDRVLEQGIESGKLAEFHASIPPLLDPTPEDHTDMICPSCGDPDCSRPFPHPEER